ncbi:MAG: NAD(P)H-hydrate epimerase [archaeon]|nr:MAG: NAD(P)H-hydrate epimerase [archaeon]
MRIAEGIAYLTAAEMAEVDREAVEEFGIGVPTLMQRAGEGAAEVAKLMLGGEVRGRAVSVLAGKGNNGGDGLVVARVLKGWGAAVEVILGVGRASLREAPSKQLALAEGAGVEVFGQARALGEPDLIVDALLGYNARGDPREAVAKLVREAGASGSRILALDVPSGLDSTSGGRGEPCVVASATATFGLPKVGLLEAKEAGVVGDLYLVDISLPEEAYRRVGMRGSPFDGKRLLRLW